MTANSLSSPPALGLNAGDGTSWGRTRIGVDANWPDVTEELLPVDRTPRTGDPERERAALLARLRTVGDWPPPAGPARRAQPGEMPRPALALRDAAVTPWRTSCWYAPAGSVPYTFERRQAGYLLTPLAYVRVWHPDGRYAVAIWIRDQLAQRGRAGAKTWGLHWSYGGGWRWRGGKNGTFPQRITATQLKAAVADPTWRADPYLIESEAA